MIRAVNLMVVALCSFACRFCSLMSGDQQHSSAPLSLSSRMCSTRHFMPPARSSQQVSPLASTSPLDLIGSTVWLLQHSAGALDTIKCVRAAVLGSRLAACAESASPAASPHL